MKSVLLSIKPVWCSKIVLKEKTVEVRKTKPEGVKPPFKCYIYCTKDQSKMG
jgi:predicted transcriptional regulator